MSQTFLFLCSDPFLVFRNRPREYPEIKRISCNPNVKQENPSGAQYNRLNLQSGRHPQHVSRFHKVSSLLQIPLFLVFNCLGPLSVHTRVSASHHSVSLRH